VESLKRTNQLLLILAVPLVFYLLHLLSFIFIPLLSSMFIALLFLPFARRMKRRNVPNFLRVLILVLIMFIMGVLAFFLLSISSQEILATKDEFIKAAGSRIMKSANLFQETIGIELMDTSTLEDGTAKKDLAMAYAKPILQFLSSSIPQLFLTFFFVVLWLAESINFEKVMRSFVFKERVASIKAFMRIEKDIIKFIRVKFLISLGTGIATGIACYAFGTSFPIFWGIFAFAINFIQMIGSFITVIMCSLFAFVEMDLITNWLAFSAVLAGVQVLFGSIIEPIYMGKSFSINIIVVLVMLMFWGFIWGIPGMIMSIPLTVFIKIVLEQFEKTQKFAKLLE
jgi:AI-2 transport protein TqsA